MLTGWFLLLKDEGQRFAVCYPFTQTPFLNGDNNWGYILFGFLLHLFFYGLFFWIVSNVFKVFFQPKLFTENGVKQLKYFYLINMFIPPILALMAKIVMGRIEEGLDIVAVIHFILGVFAYFLAAIFKQGLKLQKEQDLFI